MRVFALLILGVVRAGLNSIWFVLYDHENWLVYDFRDEKIYLFSFHHYLVFFICFIAPPVCVHHYHVLFSWSIFIIPWFRVWAKDPSFLTTIKYDAFLFFFLCYYQIFCEVQLRCATDKILLKIRKQNEYLI